MVRSPYIRSLSPGWGAYGLLAWKTGVSVAFAPQADNSVMTNSQDKILVKRFIFLLFVVHRIDDGSGELFLTHVTAWEHGEDAGQIKRAAHSESLFVPSIHYE